MEVPNTEFLKLFTLPQGHENGGISITMISCEMCGGEMYPEHYKGVHGMKYNLSDIR